MIGAKVLEQSNDVPENLLKVSGFPSGDYMLQIIDNKGNFKFEKLIEK